jgi:hypothetical protein
MAWTAFDEGDAPFGPFDRCRASENGRFARAAKQPADQLLDAPKVVGDPAVSKTDPPARNGSRKRAAPGRRGETT